MLQSACVSSVSVEGWLLLLEGIEFTIAAVYRIAVISAGYAGHSLCAFTVNLRMLWQKEGGCVRSALLETEIRSKDLVSGHSSCTVKPKGSGLL